MSKLIYVFIAIALMSFACEKKQNIKTGLKKSRKLEKDVKEGEQKVKKRILITDVPTQDDFMLAVRQNNMEAINIYKQRNLSSSFIVNEGTFWSAHCYRLALKVRAQPLTNNFSYCKEEIKFIPTEEVIFDYHMKKKSLLYFNFFNSPLLVASREGNLPMFKTLLQMGSHMDECSIAGTPFIVATKLNHVELVKFILEEHYQKLDSYKVTEITLAIKAAFECGFTDATKTILRFLIKRKHKLPYRLSLGFWNGAKDLKDEELSALLEKVYH